MLKYINLLLNIIAGVCVGAFLGHGFYIYRNYQTNPALYIAQSAPWYAGILQYGGMTVLVVAVVIVVKLVIRRKTSRSL